MEIKPDRQKILVIDDERGVRESMRMVLKDEYEIFCANRVDAGVELLRQENPDLIIMDIRMPEKSGIEGLREIREIDPVVSIVMLTGYGALETAKEAIRHGASDYLEKPFDADVMQEVVRKYVDRTKLASRRHTAQGDLQRLARSLGREVVQKNTMTALGAASTGLVRDLRNPLSIIKGYLELLSDDLRETEGPWSEDLDSYLDEIEKNVSRCSELVDSWQSLGHGDYSKLSKLSVPKVLSECIQEAEAEVVDAVFQTTIEIESGSEETLGEHSQLRRAFQNIISNAAQAVSGREDPLVQVLCKAENGTIEVQIRDNGYGVDTRPLQWVFEPLDTTATVEKGVGLGLFITKKVIEDHKGTLQFDSRLNEGTVVTIRLPQVDVALREHSLSVSLS